MQEAMPLRHSVLWMLRDPTAAAKQRALDASRGLEKAPEVVRATTGKNVGHLTTDFDWILDVELPDTATARRLLDSELHREAMRVVAAATKYDWTARLSHTMRGGCGTVTAR